MIPYTKYLIKGQFENLPIVSVRLATNHKHQTVWAIIDSGADISVFNCEIADLLDINFTKGRPGKLDGLVGDSAPAWIHQVNLTVKDMQANSLAGINTMVAFTESRDPELCILGQRRFFDNFQIRFQRYKNLIEIYPKSGTL